ncbi:MAG: ABC transporter ATP-binding protein [Burkholderiaceae bacterium]
MSLLEAENINSYYGDSHILFDVSLHVEQNEVVALLGRNGAGKSTTLKTLMGVVQPRTGKIRLDGEEVQGMPPHELAKRGMQLVPEERRIFGSITVHENLQLAAMSADKPQSFEEIYRTFPRLDERRKNRGKELSGGEQQMLTIARAMIRNARIILLDEPFEGLAPLIVKDLTQVCRGLAERGHTVIVVEQNVAAALSLSHRCYILNNGHIVHEGTPAELHRSSGVIEKYLGVKV